MINSQRVFGTHPDKWVIRKATFHWAVIPPTGSFWGYTTFHDTGEQALADFRRQTGKFQIDRETRRILSGGRSR